MEKGGRILIARRKKGGRLENKWEFPGGKLEPGETAEHCLERELFEEFGVKTKVEGFIASSRPESRRASIELLAYKVHYLSGEFRLNAHEEIRWVKPEELEGFDFAEADIRIVKKIRELWKTASKFNPKE